MITPTKHTLFIDAVCELARHHTEVTGERTHFDLTYFYGQEAADIIEQDEWEAIITSPAYRELRAALTVEFVSSLGWGGECAGGSIVALSILEDEPVCYFVIYP